MRTTKQKPKIKRVGALPVNSRIDIDYTGKKPTIKFTYPSKDSFQAVRGSPVYLFLLVIFMLIGLMIWSYFIVPYVFPSGVDKSISPLFKDQYFNNLPINTTIIIHGNYINNSFTSKISGLNISVNNVTYVYAIKPVYYFPNKHIYSDQDFIQVSPATINGGEGIVYSRMGGWIYALLTTCLVFFFPWLLTLLICKLLPRSKKFNKAFPYINKAFSGSGYYVKFDKCPDSKIIEIPMFSNVFLNYDATKDFSKYLQRVEIKEHPFIDVVVKDSKIRRMIRKKKCLREEAISELIKSKKKNLYLWNAKFIFSEVPKSGFLEVLFD